MGNYRKLSFIIVFVLVACFPNRKYVEEPGPTLAVSEDAIPTISVNDYVATQKIGNSCASVNPSIVQQSQIDYLDIYPGVTSTERVIEILGEPTEKLIDGKETNLLYDNIEGVFLSIIIVDNLVDRINVDNLEKNHQPIKEIIQNIGCPEMIMLVDRSEHSSGNYDIAVFCYPEIGAEFWFSYDQDSKLIMTSVPNEIRYFTPLGLADYIELHYPFLSVNSPFMKPVYWDEIMLDK